MGEPRVCPRLPARSRGGGGRVAVLAWVIASTMPPTNAMPSSPISGVIPAPALASPFPFSKHAFALVWFILIFLAVLAALTAGACAITLYMQRVIPPMSSPRNEEEPVKKAAIERFQSIESTNTVQTEDNFINRIPIMLMGGTDYLRAEFRSRLQYWV
mmetsp:Transcript_19743/g.55516  ORF Transcript_19743/g.55516 Transcript_19743/m.55516 type:complete len:158 (-) Transcript_19743:146-619(-)